jgi:isoleucyl-tRNA synthetase
LVPLQKTSISYKLLEPVRAIKDFIGDLSQWYLRRSRDRIKDGDIEAKATLYYVLKTLAQTMAPFAPFTAEDIWRRLRSEEDVESVHLSEWPEVNQKRKEESGKLLEEMQVVRDLCTVGNALRKKSNIPLRQPLAFFFVTEDLSDEYKEIIKDELNVKAVEKGTVIIFDERITPELKAEGDYREFVRGVQELRKQKGLTPSDRITITLSPNAESLITKFTDDFKKTVLADKVLFADNDGEKVKAGEEEFSINLEK